MKKITQDQRLNACWEGNLGSKKKLIYVEKEKLGQQREIEKVLFYKWIRRFGWFKDRED